MEKLKKQLTKAYTYALLIEKKENRIKALKEKVQIEDEKPQLERYLLASRKWYFEEMADATHIIQISRIKIARALSEAADF